MQMVADDVAFVIGGDTHGASHALAVLARATGVVLAERSIDATAAGYRAALGWARQTAPGVRVWALEGTGGYGAGLARHAMPCPQRRRCGAVAVLGCHDSGRRAMPCPQRRRCGILRA